MAKRSAIAIRRNIAREDKGTLWPEASHCSSDFSRTKRQWLFRRQIRAIDYKFSGSTKFPNGQSAQVLWAYGHKDGYIFIAA